ncbi:TetR/AcrR family transcriptional regulator [Rhodococcus sp. KBS0724]|jgi:AcrR family transcriptional regulator|uniref:TetR/AcrR family transcriptional regulator n=1 Tax=Rhodococcus sp. KBS0724 TaxID=1179674 RepID=UPI00110E1B2C|nr:TetR/AcrR family transcriptional regulator [Rhodococcus sp. KBS0724]TSD49947.1 TetR/AcrR family transcriptional regulator [Rhodococcus sp. KBS0724]
MEPQERRQQILDRAGEIFAAKGVAATTIREIGDAVGVRSGALYHYFPSKDAIVAEIVRIYLQDLVDNVHAVTAVEPTERIEALAEIALRCSHKYLHATSIWRREGDYIHATILEQGNIGELFGQFEREWSNTLAVGVAQGIFRDDVDLDVVDHMLRYAIWSSSEWHTPTEDKSVDWLAHEVVKVILGGLLRAQNVQP